MDWNVAFWTATVSVCAVLLQGYLAWSDRILTHKQLCEKGGYYGLPFIWHFGMWGDVLLLSPLLAVIVGQYASTWSVQRMGYAAGLGILASVSMHIFWVRSAYLGGGLNEAHIHYEDFGFSDDVRLSVVGWVHLLYMAGVVAIIALLYIWTPQAIGLMLTTSILMTVHMIFGNHIVLGWLHKKWFPLQPQKSAVSWGLALGSGAVLLTRALYLLVR